MKVRSEMVLVVVARPDETGVSHELLQLRRAADDFMGGTWQFIRGGMNPDENAIVAGLRELQEESGLYPREFFRLSSVESFYTPPDDTLWHAVAFLALIGRDQPVILNEEHDDLRWIHRDKIDPLLMWGSERNLLAEMYRDILESGPAKEFLRIELPRKA